MLEKKNIVHSSSCFNFVDANFAPPHLLTPLENLILHGKQPMTSFMLKINNFLRALEHEQNA